MRADPALTAHTAGIMLDVAIALADLAAPLPSTLDLGETDFGDLPSSTALASVYRESAGAVGPLLERVGQVLEGDGDRLYQLAFGLRAVEQRVAQRVGTAVGHAIGAGS